MAWTNLSNRSRAGRQNRSSASWICRSEFVLFVGTLEPRKNLVGLARAYRDLKLELPDAPKLVLVGRARLALREFNG